MINKQSPQEKILEAAQELFMEKGYHKTSVRDIAKMASVNVASINYYFNSKQSLCNEVLSILYKQCEQSILQIEKEYGHNTLLFCEHIFCFLSYKNKKIYRFFMQSFTEGLVESKTISSEGQMVGPPGSQALLRSIKKNANMKTTEQTLRWATRTLYQYINHVIKITYTHNTGISKEFSKEKFISGLKRLCRAILNDINTYQDNFT